MPAPNTPRQTARSYLMATACTGTFAFGTLVAFLGATLPELRARFGFDIAQGGTLISLLFLPQIPMSFVAGPLIDRFGKKPVLASGSLLCAVALATISIAPNYQVLAMLVFAVGLGGSCINSGSNTLVPDLYPVNPSAALNLANSFFSLGTVGFPVLVTLMARRFGLAPALVLVGVSNAIPGVLSLTQTFPAARSKGGLNWTLIRNALLNKSILLLALVILLYSSLEASTAGWLRTYFEQEFSTSAQTSGGILVAFFTVNAGWTAGSERDHEKSTWIHRGCGVCSGSGHRTGISRPGIESAGDHRGRSGYRSLLCPHLPNHGWNNQQSFPGDLRDNLWASYGRWFYRQHDLTRGRWLCCEGIDGQSRDLAPSYQRIPITRGTKYFRSPGKESRTPGVPVDGPRFLRIQG